MQIENLRINQKVKLIMPLPGLSIDRNGVENITVDDGSGRHYAGLKLAQVTPIVDEPVFPPNTNPER